MFQRFCKNERRIRFVLLLISNSVGLGNVWRFPYMTYRNGGGAFLIPYFLLYIFIGLPLYYLELSLGQFTSKGAPHAFGLVRGSLGIGISMVINSAITMCFYNVIISWALLYFLLSFRTTLLWHQCNKYWNTPNCIELSDANIAVTNGTSPVAEFFTRFVLRQSSGFHDFGTPAWYTTLCLLGAWIIVALCIHKGIKLTGRIAYITAIFPYIMLLALLIRSSLLDGAELGIRYYMTPDWSKVKNFQVWRDAAGQVFFSLGVGFGALMAYSSENEFRNNYVTQCIIVVACDCLTGIFAGFTVFSTIGFLAVKLRGGDITKAAAGGPGLAFVIYPEAISQMPDSSVFSVFFFLMLITLGLGSEFGATDVVVTFILQYFPHLKRWVVVIVVSICAFLISIPFACPGGIYLFTLVSEYAANLSLIVIGFFEVITVAYVYGFNNFMNDIQLMLDKRIPEYYLFVTWCIACPVLLLIIFFASMIDGSSKLLVEGDYQFPQWTLGVGWTIFTVCIIGMPIYYLYQYIQSFHYVRKHRISSDTEVPDYIRAFRLTNKPTLGWGPRDSKNRTGPYANLPATNGVIDNNAYDPEMNRF
jgi:SNF family Na+-dependent transporter